MPMKITKLQTAPTTATKNSAVAPSGNFATVLHRTSTPIGNSTAKSASAGSVINAAVKKATDGLAPVEDALTSMNCGSKVSGAASLPQEADESGDGEGGADGTA